MDAKYVLILVKLSTVLVSVRSETYSVKVGTESHINIVDARFLSFTVDPGYLFANNEKFISQECICMASALKPAFIRIAGPSTSHMVFRNSSISIQGDQDLEPALEPFRTSPEQRFQIADIVLPNRASLTKRASSGQDPLIRRSLSVSDRQWKKFAEWSNETGFDIVFALNNQEKMSSGMWDPNSALSLLTVAEKANIREVVWQLGYECTNQSIEEYLYDLETLRIMVETFPQGQSEGQSEGQGQGQGQTRWGVVAGDVTPCLQADSKSDFKDFVTLSYDRLDAILLDGNSSAHELAKLSERDRLKLFNLLSRSSTPLWLSDQAQPGAAELLRAADWMAGLGHSARHGFAVHFRELLEEEVFQPTLSFYMALLFKNLVGVKVLSLDFDATSERTSLFAHCTSLRRKAIPGAVTLYGANMDDEPARFSLKLSRREEGGDIMQFILGMDASGNILVNGRAMYYEGDIRPVVKRVRPYKTLLFNLPPKSFGFWVLANTKVNACYENEANEVTGAKFVKAVEIEESLEEKNEGVNKIKTKRSTEKLEDHTDIDFVEISEESNENDEITKAMKKNIEEFRITHELLKKEHLQQHKITEKSRLKRQVDDSFNAEYSKKESPISILRKPINFVKMQTKKPLPALKFRSKEAQEDKPKVGLVSRILQLNAKLNSTRHLRQERWKKLKQKSFENKSKVNKRHSDKFPLSKTEKKVKTENVDESINEKHHRQRRSILFDNAKQLNTNEISENEIDIDDYSKLGKMLHKITKDIHDLPNKMVDIKTSSDQDANAIENQFIVKTKISEDDASIKVSEKTNNGLFEETYRKVMATLGDFNDSLNKAISALSLL